MHETAWAQDPTARVAYVDLEPVAVAYGRTVLADMLGDTARTAVGQATVSHADIRHPDQVLAAPGVADLLDFGRPVAVLMIGVLHFVSDADDPATILAHYRAALTPGSVLVPAQSSSDYPTNPALAEAVQAANDRYRATSTPGHLRSRAELAALLTGWELEPPGLLDVARWPTHQRNADPLGGYGAITRPL